MGKCRAGVLKWEGDFVPQVHLSVSGDSLGYHNSGEGVCAPGIWWMKARDVAKYPIIHKIAAYSQERFLPE